MERQLRTDIRALPDFASGRLSCPVEAKIRQSVRIEASRIAGTSIEEQPPGVLSWWKDPRTRRQWEFGRNVGRRTFGQHAYRYLEIGTLRESMARRSDQKQRDDDWEKRRHPASSLVKPPARE